MTCVLHALREYSLRHDRDPAFHAAFFVLTFLAAALFNVGAFAVLVMIHMGLDLIKYHTLHKKAWHWTLRATIRESLIDILLLALALFLAVYFHESTALIALSGFVRFEGVFLGALAVVLSRMEVLCHLVGAFSHVCTHMQNVHRGIAGAWSRTEQMALLGVAACLLLVAVSPMLSANPDAVFHVLRAELIPWEV